MHTPAHHPASKLENSSPDHQTTTASSSKSESVQLFLYAKYLYLYKSFFPRDFPLFLPKAWAVVVVVVVVVMVVVVVVLNKGREISGKGVYITYTHKVYSSPS